MSRRSDSLEMEERRDTRVESSDQPNYEWEFLALDSTGHILWNYTAADGEESGMMALSSDGSGS